MGKILTDGSLWDVNDPYELIPWSQGESPV